MPNGRGAPYRTSSGLPPTPDHSSDDEETRNEKYEYNARSVRGLPRDLREEPIGSLIFSCLDERRQVLRGFFGEHATEPPPQ